MNIELEKQFVEMEKICNELDKLEDVYHGIEYNIADLESGIEKCKLGKVGKIVVGIIAFYICNLIFAGLLYGVIKNMIINYLFILVAVIGISIKFIEKQYYVFREKDRNILLHKIEQEKEKLNCVLADMKVIISANDEAFKNMPYEYIYSIAIGEMHKYVKQGRANTIPEAINLYEEQLHRWKIEEQNGQILDSQYRQEQRLANIEFYSSLSAFFD